MNIRDAQIGAPQRIIETPAPLETSPVVIPDNVPEEWEVPVAEPVPA